MDNITNMLQMSEFDKTSLDRAVLMAKGDLRQEAADELAALRAENAKLREALESVDALVAEDMGDWYSVQFAHLPASLSNLAHIRDAIQDTFEALNAK